MAKQAAKNMNLTVNSVALEDDLDNISMQVTQENPVVTSFADGGPRRVAGNYDHKLSISGNADFASGQSDATLFAMLGSAGVATGFDPTGTTAGTNDPNYDSTHVLASFTISGQVGGAVKLAAELEGTAALTRATS
jgi:hypothetical protein